MSATSTAKSSKDENAFPSSRTKSSLQCCEKISSREQIATKSSGVVIRLEKSERYLTLMLLTANLPNSKWRKKPKKQLKPWYMGTHLRVLSESYPMNTNMTGFGWFSKNLCILVRWMKVASALVGLSPEKPEVEKWLSTPLLQKWLKNDWNPGKWVLIWECSVRAIKWIPK